MLHQFGVISFFTFGVRQAIMKPFVSRDIFSIMRAMLSRVAGGMGMSGYFRAPDM